ncbi:hypothetical protein ES332_D05G033100v1 [Gossypium tomentosum]|uniref:DUF4283 domain-containing protein n=1 Tax=Gossypium tomentosum TaxID=34277 RepID=A0A5D2KQZ5_GOSTO|nr:hypothetical protein ES332_D05G033100v1 [Gossypium tomentosum]
MDESDCGNVTIPTIQINKEWKSQLRQPWRKALIIKLLGKTITFNALVSRLSNLWVTMSVETLQIDFFYHPVSMWLECNSRAKKLLGFLLPWGLVFTVIL